MKYPNAYADFTKVREFFAKRTNTAFYDIDRHSLFMFAGHYVIGEGAIISEDTAIALMCDSMETKLLSYGYSLVVSSPLSTGEFFVCVGGWQSDIVKTKFDGLVQACLELPEHMRESKS